MPAHDPCSAHAGSHTPGVGARSLLVGFVLLAVGCAAPEDLVCDSEDADVLRVAGRDVVLRPRLDERVAPRGTVVLFHGLGESACTWVDRVEGRRLSDRLRSLGFRVLAPDSGPTTSSWAVSWPANDDADGVERTLEALADLGEVDLSLPAFALGHSNGGTFAPIWAEVSALDVRAAVNANGWGSDALGASAAPPRLLFVTAVNDVIVPPAVTRAAVNRAEDAGHDVDSVENEPQFVEPGRFARIPTLDESDSEEIFAALDGAGLLNDDATLSSNPRLDRRWESALPDRFDAHRDAIEEQLHVLYAEHRFSSDNSPSIEAFFEAALVDEEP